MTPGDRQRVCQAAWDCYREGGSSLSNLPRLIRKIITEECWTDREILPGRIAKPKSFREFITAKPLEGWGEDPKKIEALLQGSDVLKDFQALVYDEPLKDVGRPAKEEEENVSPVNILEPAKGGNRSNYLLRRIARDRPDVFERFKQGEFSSVKAAAREAGIVKVPSPLAELRRAWKKATDKERREFQKEIGS